MGAYAIVIFILLLFYTFYVGFNDGSTAIATTVVSRAFTPRQAIVISAITKFIIPIAMFFIGTGAVASNINDSLILRECLESVTPEQGFAFVFSGIVGALIWGIIAFLFKIPNTITHTLLGGIIGAGIGAFGFNSIMWTDYVLLNVVAMVLLAPIVGFLLGFVFMRITKKLVRHAPRRMNTILQGLQRVNIIILTGAFAANNSQKSLGVLMLMSTVGLLNFGATETPFWIVIIIAGALTLGMLFGGFRVMSTVGKKIFKIAPIHSVVSQFTTSLVSIVGTGLGISLGMGQTMTSSVVGVGAAERVKSVHWATPFKIVVGWCLTLPISMLASFGVYQLVKLIMGI